MKNGVKVDISGAIELLESIRPDSSENRRAFQKAFREALQLVQRPAQNFMPEGLQKYRKSVVVKTFFNGKDKWQGGSVRLTSRAKDKSYILKFFDLGTAPREAYKRGYYRDARKAWSRGAKKHAKSFRGSIKAEEFFQQAVKRNQEKAKTFVNDALIRHLEKIAKKK